MDFEEANKAIHKVEDQWHYQILTEYGWIPETLTEVGFVRSYTYINSNYDIKITVTTGASCDYWVANNSDNEKVNEGFWSSLESFVKESKNG